VRVPRTWDDRTTVGNGRAPYVAASPDLPGFLDGFEAPGLTVVVVPTPDRPGDALASYDFEACTNEGRRRYADGDVSGVFQVWRDCDETDTDIVTLTVTPEDGRDTAVVLAQLTSPADLAALREAVATVRF
jgi:hypothetical protein